MKNRITGPGKPESSDISQQADPYETFTGGNNFFQSKPAPKSEEEKLQYMELAIKYRDINPVYTKLSK